MKYRTKENYGYVSVSLNQSNRCVENKYFALCARFKKYTKEYWFTKKIEHCTISTKINADEYCSKLNFFADKVKL